MANGGGGGGGGCGGGGGQFIGNCGIGQQQQQTSSSSSYHSSNNFDQSLNNSAMAAAVAANLFSVNGRGGGPTSNCSSSSGSLIVRQKHNTIKRGKKEKPTQRVRTVLNEAQLKLLKNSYNQNQRPDTATKEMLVEQTGLNARVIRVWFQNKRCKDKKRQIEQREKQQTMEKEQALRGVRLNGIGPLTVCSPGPISLIEHQQHKMHEQFHNAVEIHQIQQTPNIWEGTGVEEQNQHLIEASFSNSMGIINPSTAMHIPVSMPPMFIQHAISE
ncbi:hypothetical protein Mgra_00002257 [Meloidogyne graminicola]|uniref:Homeobox domain-containing protein n=1 Tax=Meloidogyne graminicola TaxID=189291 RepID=A0A8S9ZZH0_9BILA|nr:hypothetical protein Mgra_00002257 [Meloidogyne graminicola]